jgi:hypothetical protein
LLPFVKWRYARKSKGLRASDVTSGAFQGFATIYYLKCYFALAAAGPDKLNDEDKFAAVFVVAKLSLSDKARSVALRSDCGWPISFTEVANP